MLRDFLGLSRRSGSLENPQVSLQDVDGWNALYGGEKSEAGIKVTKKKALMYAPFWCAVDLISGTGAKLPLNLFQRRPDLGENGRARDDKHRASYVVRRRANREQVAFFFWRQMWCHLLVYNNAYAYISQREPGSPEELFPLLPDRTAPERLRGKKVYDETGDKKLAQELDGQLVYVSEVNGKLRTFMPSEVLHFKGITLDGLAGCDLVDHAKNAIALALAQEKFASRFFRGGARMGGVLELPAGGKKEHRDKIEKGFTEKYDNPDGWFKTVILREGSKFHQAAFNPGDAQLVEGSEAQARQVARFFKMPARKLGLADSTSYGSADADNQAFYDDTLSDKLCMIAAECGGKLLTLEQERGDTHFFEHNAAALLQTDVGKRYSAYEKAIRGRWLTRNEVRAKENEPPVKGGDEFDPAPGAGNAAPPPPKEEEPRQAALAVLETIAGRARHKAKNLSAFRQWVGSAKEDLRAQFRDCPGASDEGEEKLFAAVDETMRSVLSVAGNDQQALRRELDAALFRLEGQIISEDIL